MIDLNQQDTWNIKSVFLAMVSRLRDGVSDTVPVDVGAQCAYLGAIDKHPQISQPIEPARNWWLDRCAHLG